MIRIGTAPRGNVMKNFAPGPGAYSEQLVINLLSYTQSKNGPKYTFAGKKSLDTVMF